MVRNPPAKQETKIPWRREWLATPVFLPGKSHGQTSLTDYSPQGQKELDMTERLTHTYIYSFSDYLHIQIVTEY